MLGGQKFAFDAEVPFIIGLDSSQHLFASGIQNLVGRSDECLNQFG